MNKDIERAIALAVAELRRHGGTEAQVEALRAQFKIIAGNEDHKLTKIPD